MRKANLKQRVLDALTTVNPANRSNSASNLSASSVDELDSFSREDSDAFLVCKIVRHGFPHRPTCLTYDPLQKLLAIGNREGGIRIFGRSGVDLHVTHESEVPIIQLLFMVNEGGLISSSADGSIHMWNLRQKKPGILHSLKFNREKITYCHLPYKSKWLYVGTDRGNVHLCCIETFQLSGYVINWNKAIDLSQKNHPGHVVGISENPCNEGKLLIAFQSGLIVLWDLKTKSASHRYRCKSSVTSVDWHHEGKQFMSSHADGSLCVWDFSHPAKPQQIQHPHAKSSDSSKSDSFHPISRAEWKACSGKDPFVIFNGGLPSAERQPSVTVMHGKSITVLTMDYNVIDFVCISATPWRCDSEDPTVLVILLEKELVALDLTTPGYPCVEFPHPIDIHDSPVTCLQYITDYDSDLTPGLHQVAASKPKRSSYSKTEWPLQGGEWSIDSCTGFPEILVSGHADGTVRFWDASAVSLKALCKLRTYKFFKDGHDRSTERDQYAITHICIDTKSHALVIANEGNTVIGFDLKKEESVTKVNYIEISASEKGIFGLDSPTGEELPQTPNDASIVSRQSSEVASTSTPSDRTDSVDTQVVASSKLRPLLRLKSGTIKQSCGYQASLICQLVGPNADQQPLITALEFNASSRFIAIASLNGVCVVDWGEKVILLNISAIDVMYAIESKKAPKSPNKMQPPTSLGDLLPANPSETSQLKSPSDNSNGRGHTPHKEPSVTSEGSSSGHSKQRNPLYRALNKRASSSSFEKSLDSQTSFNLDDSAFSHASSALEQQYREVVSCLTFADTTGKGDVTVGLWFGTDSGNLLTLDLGKTSGKARVPVPVVLSPGGSLVQMRGGIAECFFLNSLGHLIKQPSGNLKSKLPKQNSADGSTSGASPEMSRARGSSTALSATEEQYAVITSERQIKVIALTGQAMSLVHTVFVESGDIVRSQIVTSQSSTYLLCCTMLGNMMVFSLPRLTVLFDSPYLPPNDARIAQTIHLTCEGQAVYMPTPSEVQRLACSVEMQESVQEIAGHLFIPCQSPERPVPGFFKSLFGGGVNVLDREELFGEASGKASQAVAKHIPGSAAANLEGLRGAAQLTEMQKLRMQALERGEKLSELEEKTQQMQESASKFSKNAHTLMLKYKNKKWYQL